MIIYRCDGCLADLQPIDAVKCAMAAQPFGQQAIEQFCPTCLERSTDYWTQKQSIIDDMGKLLAKRITNFKRSFFKNASKGSPE